MPQGVLDDPSSLYKQEVPTLGTFVFHPCQRPIVAMVGPNRPCCAGSGGVGAGRGVGSGLSRCSRTRLGGGFSAGGSAEAPGTERVALNVLREFTLTAKT